MGRASLSRAAFSASMLKRPPQITSRDCPPFALRVGHAVSAVAQKRVGHVAEEAREPSCLRLPSAFGRPRVLSGDAALARPISHICATSALAAS